MFIRILHTNGRNVEILTSGIKYCKSIEDAFVNDKLKMVVSIDSGTKETYLKIKGVDCFDKVIENLRKYVLASDFAKENITLKYIIVDKENDATLKSTLEEAESILTAGGFSNITINEVCIVQDANQQRIGYVASVSLKAYDAMTLTFGYTTEGVCTGLAFLEIKETPGIGMKADEPEFKNQFVNKKGDQLVAVKSGASAENEINAITGATFTTDGVIRGINAGICFMSELQNRLGGAN